MARIDIAEYIPLVFVFVSGFGFSVQGLIQRLLSEDGFHDTFDSVFIKGLMQMTISGAFVYFDEDRRIYSKPILGDSLKIKVVVLLRAFFGFLTIGATLLTLDALPLGDATVLIMLGPFFASVFSFIFLGEPWLYPEMAACFVALIGVCFVARPQFLFGDSSDAYGYIGYIYGILSGMFGGLSFMTIRMLGTSCKMNWRNVCFIQGIAQAVLAIPCIFIAGQGYGSRLTPWEYEVILISGIIAACAQLCMTIGLQQVKSATGTSVRMSEIIGSFILQVLFTKDRVNGFSVVGAILVLISIAIVIVFKRSGSEVTVDIEDRGCWKWFERSSAGSSDGFRLIKPSSISRTVLLNKPYVPQKPRDDEMEEYVSVPLFELSEPNHKMAIVTTNPLNSNSAPSNGKSLLAGPFFYSYEHE